MRQTRRAGSFLMCLLFNMLLNLDGTIPAWILLALHFWLGWSIWWFWGALGAWVLYLTSWMLFLRWASRCSRPDPPKKNKNPYSNRNEDLFGK